MPRKNPFFFLLSFFLSAFLLTTPPALAGNYGPDGPGLFSPNPLIHDQDWNDVQALLQKKLWYNIHFVIPRRVERACQDVDGQWAWNNTSDWGQGGQCSGIPIDWAGTCNDMGGKWLNDNPGGGWRCHFKGGGQPNGNNKSPWYRDTSRSYIYRGPAFTASNPPPPMTDMINHGCQTFHEIMEESRANHHTEEWVKQQLAIRYPRQLACNKWLALNRARALCYEWGDKWTWYWNKDHTDGKCTYDGGPIACCVEIAASAKPLCPACSPPPTIPPGSYDCGGGDCTGGGGGNWTVTPNPDGTYTVTKQDAAGNITKQVTFTADQYGTWSYNVDKDTNNPADVNMGDKGTFDPTNDGSGNDGWNWQSNNNGTNWGTSGKVPPPKSGDTGNTNTPTPNKP